MLDRLSLYIKNGWFDALNRVHIIYMIEDAMEDMHCSIQKVCKLSLIYVLKFSTVCSQNDPESQF